MEYIIIIKVIRFSQTSRFLLAKRVIVQIVIQNSLITYHNKVINRGLGGLSTKVCILGIVFTFLSRVRQLDFNRPKV